MPRLGPRGAEELWRARRMTRITVFSPVLAAAAGLLVGTSVLSDIGAAVLALGTVGLWVGFSSCDRSASSA
jgi:hypothetical protein